MRSSLCRSKSATGTNEPAICTCERPNWMCAMSLAPGSCSQPDWDTSCCTFAGLPQVRQVARSVSGPVMRQYGHGYASTEPGEVGVLMAAVSLGQVMVIHRLDADAARPGELRHVQFREPARLHARNRHGVELDRGILVQEFTRLDQDRFAGAERALQHVAVAVQHEHAGVFGRDEA